MHENEWKMNKKSMKTVSKRGVGPQKPRREGLGEAHGIALHAISVRHGIALLDSAFLAWNSLQNLFESLENSLRSASNQLQKSFKRLKLLETAWKSREISERRAAGASRGRSPPRSAWECYVEPRRGLRHVGQRHLKKRQRKEF